MNFVAEIEGIAVGVKNQIEAFKPYVGVIQALRNPGIKSRHFEELSKSTGIQMALTPVLTFKDLVNAGIMNFEDVVKEIAENAAKEYAIEGALNRMKSEWEWIKMEVMPYKATGKVTKNIYYPG